MERRIATTKTDINDTRNGKVEAICNLASPIASSHSLEPSDHTFRTTNLGGGMACATNTSSKEKGSEGSGISSMVAGEQPTNAMISKVYQNQSELINCSTRTPFPMAPWWFQWLHGLACVLEQPALSFAKFGKLFKNAPVSSSNGFLDSKLYSIIFDRRVVHACPIIIVHACTTIIVHACTILIVHVSCR